MNIFEFIFSLIVLVLTIVGGVLLILFQFFIIFGMLVYFSIDYTVEKITESNWFNKIKRIFK